MKQKRKNFIKQLTERINTTIDETPIDGFNKSPKDYRTMRKQFRESIEVNESTTQNVQKSAQNTKNNRKSENDRIH